MPIGTYRTDEGAWLVEATDAGQPLRAVPLVEPLTTRAAAVAMLDAAGDAAYRAAGLLAETLPQTATGEGCVQCGGPVADGGQTCDEC